MLVKIRKIAVAALSAGAMLAVGMAPATAGADVVDNRDCKKSQSGCLRQHAVSNEVETPSGNYIYQSNGKVSKNSGSQYEPSYETSFHRQELRKDGSGHVNQYRESSDFEISDDFSCSDETAYHYVDGEAQFNNREFSCSS